MNWNARSLGDLYGLPPGSYPNAQPSHTMVGVPPSQSGVSTHPFELIHDALPHVVKVARRSRNVVRAIAAGTGEDGTTRVIFGTSPLGGSIARRLEEMFFEVTWGHGSETRVSMLSAVVETYGNPRQGDGISLAREQVDSPAEVRELLTWHGYEFGNKHHDLKGQNVARALGIELQREPSLEMYPRELGTHLASAAGVGISGKQTRLADLARSIGIC